MLIKLCYNYLQKLHHAVLENFWDNSNAVLEQSCDTFAHFFQLREFL